MRIRSMFSAMIVVMPVIGGLGVLPARAVQRTTDKPTVQAPEGKALVYFVRPKHVSRLSTFLYIDDEFVGALEDNSFSYAFVEEGRHELWTFLTVDIKTGWTQSLSNSMLPRPWEGSRFSVVRGRTYYFRMNRPGYKQDVQLEETEGAKWVEKVKFYSSPTQEEVEASAQLLETRDSEAIERLELAYAEIPDHPTPEVPADRTGLLRIDANTEVSLMLVQNLWSEGDSTGDEVWFRVTSDSASAEGVWLPEGTLVRGILHYAKDRWSSGSGGVLDVVIPAVVAIDGTVVPTQGEIREQGGRASKGQRVGWILLTAVQVGVALLGGDAGGPGSRGGKDAFLFFGSTATIYTRDTVWIAPESAAIGPGEQTSHPSPLRLRVPTSAKVQLRGKDFGRQDDLKFLLDLPDPPALVRVRSIAGQSVPVEIRAFRGKKVRKGWRCFFDWWEIVKFLPLADEHDRIEIELDGVLQDGTTFVADAAVDKVVS